ncbi:MAG: AtpZ/AtpI family protein [Nitrospiraceae bacterium]|nr:AtpZ/AtpI family protein [Nitrospiraceae bacterium]
MAKTNLRQLLDASMVGINLVVSTFVGLAIGYFLDKLLGTSPWLLIAFTFLGIVAGFIELFKFINKKEAGRNDNDKKGL